MPAPLSQTTGRRKQAVARVRFRPGQGAITVNKQPIEAYSRSARIVDSTFREKESKKYGLKKARKAPQYSKR